MSGAPPPEPKRNPGWFRTGETGNGRGRPRKLRPAPESAYDVIVEQKLNVRRDGALREITVEEALQHRTYQDAIAGKRLAQRQILKWIARREAWLAEHRPKTPSRPIVWRSEEDSDNANEALMLLGVVRANPDREYRSKGKPALLLEPWAVQAALKRRRRPLTEAEIAEIRRCTRDAESVRFPNGVNT